MLDFEKELARLLSREWGMLPQYEFAELAMAGQSLLTELEKKQSDVSLQIEEIYDLAKEQRGLIEALENEKGVRNRLVSAAMGIADLIEYFYAHARQSGNEDLRNQAGIMWQNSVALLASCGVFQFGKTGEPLDPRMHTVKASAESPFPREYVTDVLQSGYVYQGGIIRKAAVVVSLGQATEKAAQPDDALRSYGTDGNREQQNGITDHQDDRPASGRYQEKQQDQNNHTI
jgi:molecular chaperone GrpE (heat shock protein)